MNKIDLDEFKGFGWRLTPDLKIEFSNENYYSEYETETHYRYDKVLDQYIVCTNNKRDITRLKRHPKFHVTNLVLSPKKRILSVSGVLPPWALSLRTKCRSKPSLKDKSRSYCRRPLEPEADV